MSVLIVEITDFNRLADSTNDYILDLTLFILFYIYFIWLIFCGMEALYHNSILFYISQHLSPTNYDLCCSDSLKMLLGVSDPPCDYDNILLLFS